MMNILLRTRSILFCIFILVALTSSGVCDELRSKAHEEGDYRNKVSLFGGNTQDDSENGASIGLEYEYRINPRFGIGGLGEYAGGDFDSWVIGIPVFIHPLQVGFSAWPQDWSTKIAKRTFSSEPDRDTNLN